MDLEEEVAKIEPVCFPWHKPLMKQLQSLKQQQRLPHAILLDSTSEEDGAGFIWQLAMLLLCNEVTDITPCGQCPACQLMLSNTYPDFRYVSLQHDDKSKKINKNIKIEQIRDLIHEVNLTNRYDNLKIIAIYPAEKMNLASANSLLKTLEEPGSQVLILLLTHNKGKLPITIRSRCQSWSLDRPGKQVAQNWMLDRGFDQEESEQYLEYAGGDPLLALKLKSVNYASLVDEFKRRFSLYLKNGIDVTALCSKLIKHEVSLIRRLIKMVISAYCYRLSGLDSSFQVQNSRRKYDARDMIELSGHAERQLMVEDNNLNLQIQLEDVLISLKQIIKRSKD